MKTKSVLLFKTSLSEPSPETTPMEGSTAEDLSVEDFSVAAPSIEDEAFTEIFHRHQALVRTVIFQIAGPSSLNDLEQEAFIKIWKGLSQFRDEARLTSWIYRISVNVAIDSLRSTSRHALVVPLGDDEPASDRTSTEAELANRQLVQLGLKELSEEHRTVVVLALIHDRPLEEIADILSLSLGTVKSRLHYGKEHFRRVLEKRGIQS
jgi:RNA polymerase sigma-70 factor (ECF subfamily)